MVSNYLAEETLITTSNGLETIGSVREKLYCYAYDCIGGIAKIRIADIPSKNSISDLYELSTESGNYILMSMDSQLMSINGWRKLSDLSIGDIVLCAFEPDDIYADTISNISFVRHDAPYSMSETKYGNFLAQGFIIRAK